MPKWTDQVDPKVKEAMTSYETNKRKSQDELQKVMPEVTKFYNERDPDKDVYHFGKGAIFFIENPKKQVDADGNITNKKKKYDSKYGGEPQYQWFCKFMINGTFEAFSVFATKEQWIQIGSFSTQAFVFGGFGLKYYKIGSSLNSDGKKVYLKEPGFLKKYYEGLTSIEDVDESEYIISYGTTVWDVITEVVT